MTDIEAVTRLLKVAHDRWISNPELVIDEVRRYAARIIPEHPLIKAKTLRAEKEAHTEFVVVTREQLREIEWVADNDSSFHRMFSYCPVCGNDARESHTSYCWLGNLLKEE